MLNFFIMFALRVYATLWELQFLGEALRYGHELGGTGYDYETRRQRVAEHIILKSLDVLMAEEIAIRSQRDMSFWEAHSLTVRATRAVRALVQDAGWTPERVVRKCQQIHAAVTEEVGS